MSVSPSWSPPVVGLRVVVTASRTQSGHDHYYTASDDSSQCKFFGSRPNEAYVEFPKSI
jgi:hypothetical protein